MHNSGTITGTITFNPSNYTYSIVNGYTGDLITYDNIGNIAISSDDAQELRLTTENGFNFGAYVDERLFSEEEEIEDVDLPVEYML